MKLPLQLLISLIALLVFQVALANADKPSLPEHTKQSQLRQVASYYIDNKAFSGAILVSESGKVVFHHLSGTAKQSSDKPINQDSLFPLASLSKPLTAALVLRLVEAGKLKLDDKVSRFIPEFDKNSHHQIRLQHLLSHTSGLANHFAIPGWFDPTFHQNTSDKQFVRIIADTPLVGAPSDSYHYSNPGYFLLGKIIEQVTQQTLQQSLQNYLFHPLAMSHSGILLGFDQPQDLVEGYQWQSKGGYRQQLAKNMNLFGAGAAIYATAADLHRFELALYDNTLLSDSSKAKLFDQQQAYSWRVTDFEVAADLQVKVHNYDGNFDGYSSMITRFIDHKHSIILLSNNGTSFHLKQQLTADLAKVLYQQQVTDRSQDADLMLINSIVSGTFAEQLAKLEASKSHQHLSEQGLSSLAYDLLWSNLPQQSLQLFHFISRRFASSSTAAANLDRACQHRLSQKVTDKTSYCD